MKSWEKIFVESVLKVRQKNLGEILAEYLSGKCAKSEGKKYLIFDEIHNVHLKKSAKK